MEAAVFGLSAAAAVSALAAPPAAPPAAVSALAAPLAAPPGTAAAAAAVMMVHAV